MNDPVANSPLMQSFFAAGKEAGRAKAPVLITGESGSGKSHWAHHLVKQAGFSEPAAVFSSMACDPAQIAAALDKPQAVVLDELAGLPHLVQRILIELLDKSPKAWVISLTRDEPVAAVAGGRLMAALLHRVDVFRLGMPPLRARSEDIVPLATQLLREHGEATGRHLALGPSAIEAILKHEFAGNVRELSNALVRGAAKAGQGWIEASDLNLTRATPGRSLLPPEVPIDLEALERLAIAEALRRVNGNRTHAARLLGIGLRTLRAKLNARARLEAVPVERKSA